MIDHTLHTKAQTNKHKQASNCTALSSKPSSMEAFFARFMGCGATMMCAVMGLMIAVSSSPAMAQDAIRPPRTTEEPSSPKIVVYLIAVLLMAGVVFASSLRSKRTHQD